MTDSVVIGGISALMALGLIACSFGLMLWGLIKGGRAHAAGAPISAMYWPTVMLGLGVALVMAVL